MRHARQYEDDDVARGPKRPSWSSRLAWLTLMAGGFLLVTRVSVATVVEVHGEGMAPTLRDGDHVVLVRQTWGLERGDIVVYDPTPVKAAPPRPAAPVDAPRGHASGRQHPAPSEVRGPALRNTAVVDRQALDANWERLQSNSEGLFARERTALRLGRVLALPGDEVTFFTEGGALGLTINGETIEHKPGQPLRLDVGPEALDPAALAYELLGDRRYPVLAAQDGDTRWPGLGLPAPSSGPVQVTAEGYLVVADNREEGACCDSRALGWVAESNLRGRVLVRLAGDPGATGPDHAARGFLWKP